MPQVIPHEEIETYARHFVESFIKGGKISTPLDMELVFYPDSEAYERETGHAFVDPVYSEIKGKHFTLHICEANLVDIPSLALQGWMEHETVRCLLDLNGNYKQFNYRKNIFPLMPVTGLAENHMLELIRFIELGLKKYHATKTLVDGGRGLQQAHFYFFAVTPIVEDQSNYRETLPHPWTKALFICRKFREFMPISSLSVSDVEFSQELLGYWWKTHDYLLSDDRAVLNELADIPQRFEDFSYPEIVTEVFKKIQSHYLLSPKDTVPSAPPERILH